jgi:hypothetical protein
MNPHDKGNMRIARISREIFVKEKCPERKGRRSRCRRSDFSLKLPRRQSRAFLPISAETGKNVTSSFIKNSFMV